MSGYGGEEYEYEWPDDDGGADQEDWGSDPEANQENNPRIEVENCFYEAEGNVRDAPKQAVE